MKVHYVLDCAVVQSYHPWEQLPSQFFNRDVEFSNCLPNYLIKPASEGVYSEALLMLWVLLLEMVSDQ